MSTRTKTKTTSKDTNSIVIEEEDNQNKQLDTSANPNIHILRDLDTIIIYSGEELLYFIKRDSQYHPLIPNKESVYLNSMIKEQMYPSIYGDGNCAIYASLLSIRQLAYEVVKFEKLKI